MAEAYQGVSYSELIKTEHTEADHNKEVLQLVWDSGLNNWKKRWARWKIFVRNRVYPAHLESLWVVMSLVNGFHFSSRGVPFDLVNVLLKFVPENTLGWQITSCCTAGFIYWITVGLSMRYTLKMLLMYKGFMYEGRGSKVSWKTKVWGALVKFFVMWNTPSLYSFQESLPRLPLPSVKDTMKRYLRSVRPLLEDEAYEKVRKQAEEFENGLGKRLQRYLWLKSWWSSNYVSDWWEEYVYLRGRSPLMVYSSYGGPDCMSIKTNNQTARAANFIYHMLQFRKKIERQEMKPIMIQGLVPLCSWQYERMFNTVRVPGIEGDKLVHYEDIDHIVVFHKGCYYKMLISLNGKLLNPHELKNQLDQIMATTERGSHGETFLASLTSWERSKWAKAREEYFSEGMNKASLKEVETAAFFLVMNEKPFEYFKPPPPGELFDYYSECVHGKIFDRWYDKSFNLVFGSNAMYSLLVEHTWADGGILGHLMEEVNFDDNLSYDDKGNLKGSMRFKPPKPTRIRWEFNESMVKTIDEAYNDGIKIATDLDVKFVIHDFYGKGFVKICRVSPDGYIQMALQLAYFREFGKFNQTYESSTTRLFREGRTETVRSCTIESCAWVRAMENKSVSVAERVKLLKEACAQHQRGYLDAMCGRGVDRHLFCLYVVSKYLEVDSPFLNEVISEPWRLSTSQVPHGQTARIDLKKYPELANPGGGFGPVTHDGYGVSYIISGENRFFFTVTSFKSCEVTDSTRFADRLFKALQDIKEMFEEFNKAQKKKD